MIYLLSPNHTLQKSGAKSVPPIAKEKNKRLTGMFTVTKLAISVPLQLIHQRKQSIALHEKENFRGPMDSISQRIIGASRSNEKGLDMYGVTDTITSRNDQKTHSHSLISIQTKMNKMKTNTRF